MNRISLFQLTYQIKNLIILNSKKISIQTVFDEMAKFCRIEKDDKAYPTLKRRVYDIINILASIDLIQKDGKDIWWNNDFSQNLKLNSSVNPNEQLQTRIMKKKENLNFKIRLLGSYLQLMKNNLNKPSGASNGKKISFPLLIFLYPARSNVDYSLSLNEDELLIDYPETLFSPCDIIRQTLKVKGFQSTTEEVFSNYPKINEYISQMKEQEQLGNEAFL